MAATRRPSEVTRRAQGRRRTLALQALDCLARGYAATPNDADGGRVRPVGWEVGSDVPVTRGWPVTLAEFAGCEQWWETDDPHVAIYGEPTREDGHMACPRGATHNVKTRAHRALAVLEILHLVDDEIWHVVDDAGDIVQTPAWALTPAGLELGEAMQAAASGHGSGPARALAASYGLEPGDCYLGPDDGCRKFVEPGVYDDEPTASE
jgi:hypothetical protein